jgi:hypothetical protein
MRKIPENRKRSNPVTDKISASLKAALALHALEGTLAKQIFRGDVPVFDICGTSAPPFAFGFLISLVSLDWADHGIELNANLAGDGPEEARVRLRRPAGTTTPST